MCSGRVCRLQFICGPCCVAHGVVFLTKRTYPASSVKQKFFNGQLTRDGGRNIFGGMISSSLFGTIGLMVNFPCDHLSKTTKLKPMFHDVYFRLNYL